MASIYQAFLQNPTASSLADDASLHYITTTTTISEPAAILKHLGAQAKQVVKKAEDVVYSIEGDNGLCLETNTSLKFVTGGGAYLPSIDSNLLDDRQVYLPVTHIVTFNDQNQIHQIRLYWDQGTLLKQVEAIGKSGRNWPIRDGKAQSQTVKSSVDLGSSTSAAGSAKGSAPAAAPRQAEEVTIRERPNRDSVSVTRDPHASLNLFAERDPNAGDRSYSGPGHATRASAKPAPRDYNDLFANEDTPPRQTGSQFRSQSPHKQDGTVLKSGAGKHYQEVRLFDEVDDDDESVLRSPERKKTFNQKFEHFAFGDGEDAPQVRPNAGRNKNTQTFSFDDSAPPPKAQEKLRPAQQRHWGAGVDAEDPDSPPQRPVVHAARPDAESHFILNDEPPSHSKITPRQRKGGIQDHNSRDASEGTKPTHPVVNNSRRDDDFGSHYDVSPANDPRSKTKSTVPRTGLDSQWGYETPPKPRKIYKTAGDGMGARTGARDHDDGAGEADKKIYKTAGDGMGGRAGARGWGIGDESDPEVQAEKSRAGPRGRRAQQELEF